MSDERLDLRIANDLAELARVAKSVDAFCIERAVPAASTFKLNAALEELLTTMISNAYPEGKAHGIDLSLACDGQTLVAELSEEAAPYNLLEAPPADLDAGIEERSLGGHGIPLIKTLMDEVNYAYEGGCNRITLRKRIVSDAG